MDLKEYTQAKLYLGRASCVQEEVFGSVSLEYATTLHSSGSLCVKVIGVPDCRIMPHAVRASCCEPGDWATYPTTFMDHMVVEEVNFARMILEISR